MSNKTSVGRPTRDLSLDQPSTMGTFDCVKTTCRSLKSLASTSVATVLVGIILLPAARAEVPKFRPVRNATEAVERIEELGGAVRYLNAKRDALEVDFRFAIKGLNDAHLQYVLSIKNVTVVRLKRTPITDAGLVHLGKVSTLERLYLEETAVSDAGLKHVASLPKLQFLNLYGTKVSDAGLERLKGLSHLRRLFVGKTKVTEAGIAALKKAAPKLLVIPNRPEQRRRAQLVMDVATKLHAVAKERFTAAERELKELGPRQAELKKEADAAKKQADEARGKADELKKQHNEANQTANDVQRAADEAQKQSDAKPDDEALKLEAKQKQQAADEAKKRAAEIKKQFDAAQCQTNAAQAKSEMAKKLHERSTNAQKQHDLAKRILEAANLRLADARRSLQVIE